MVMNRTQTIAATISLGALALAGRVGADPVAFTQTPLSNAVAQLNRQYGINIVLKGSLTQTPGQRITFSVADPATRLQVVNALANAAGVDFQKGYVVSKVPAGQVTPPVDVDSNGYIIFKSTTLSAADAINTIASTDNATVQISPDVTGNVVLSATTLRTADAARQIARQTHTRWRTYYALTPAGVAGGGKVVDRNSSGQAIVELPFTYYGTKTPPKAAGTGSATGTGVASLPASNGPVPANGPGGPAFPAQQDASNGIGNTNGVSVAPYNYMGSPYFSYSNGYSYGPGGQLFPTTTGGFGYGGMSYGNPGGFGGGVNILPGTGGYGPFGGYGGSPVTIGGLGGGLGGF